MEPIAAIASGNPSRACDLDRYSYAKMMLRPEPFCFELVPRPVIAYQPDGANAPVDMPDRQPDTSVLPLIGIAIVRRNGTIISRMMLALVILRLDQSRGNGDCPLASRPHFSISALRRDST